MALDITPGFMLSQGNFMKLRKEWIIPSILKKGK
jgi:hypothetical protein